MPWVRNRAVCIEQLKQLRWFLKRSPSPVLVYNTYVAMFVTFVHCEIYRMSCHLLGLLYHLVFYCMHIPYLSIYIYISFKQFVSVFGSFCSIRSVNFWLNGNIDIWFVSVVFVCQNFFLLAIIYLTVFWVHNLISFSSVWWNII